MRTDDAKRDRAGVPEEANRDGEVRDRWDWAERAVWTERMLTALEKGLKGGVWYSLIDKVAAMETLHAAFEQVKRNKGAAGSDHVTIGAFEGRLEKELRALKASLLSGSYTPSVLRRTWIEKPGKKKEKRPLGIPTIRDRVVQAALKIVMEPIFEQTFHPGSYGFRPNRTAHQALMRIKEQLNGGSYYVVDVDIRKFFDSISHGRLMSLISERISDGRVLTLIQSFLEAGVLDGEEIEETTSGTPQGGVISPLLANIYLNELDHSLTDAGHTIVRYADDSVILSETMETAEAALRHIRTWITDAELELHPEKTRIVNMTEPRACFEFLGFRFLCHIKKGTGKKRIYRFVRPASKRKVKERLRHLTRRNNGKSLEEIIKNVNGVLHGWFGYFRSCHVSDHTSLDSWVRRRLRSILRRRKKRKGISKGSDHQRWPNAFFYENGLFSLEMAHLKYVSPLER